MDPQPLVTGTFTLGARFSEFAEDRQPTNEYTRGHAGEEFPRFVQNQVSLGRLRAQIIAAFDQCAQRVRRRPGKIVLILAKKPSNTILKPSVKLFGRPYL